MARRLLTRKEKWPATTQATGHLLPERSDLLLGGLTRPATTIAVNLRHLEPSYRAFEFGGGDCAQVAAGVGMRQQFLGALAGGLGVLFVNLGGALGVVRQDRHDVVVDLEEAARHEEASSTPA